MKYWWLQKYQKLGIKQLPDLCYDLNYFLVMPKRYLKIFDSTKDILVDELNEYELLIHLYVLVTTKKIKDNRVLLIINRLLTFPDTNLPVSDYSLTEMFEEIVALRENVPISNKLDYNNIASCYRCLQTFYIDLIYSTNQKGICLCPFCHSTLLYFDNDYVPMNYSFLKLASFYYGISPLGCKFENLQIILKKCVTLQMGDIVPTDRVIGKTKQDVYWDYEYSNLKKITSREEQEFIKSLFDHFQMIEKDQDYQVSFLIDKISVKLVNHFALLVLISIMEVLSKSIYLKKVCVVCKDLKMYQAIKSQKKILERRIDCIGGC
ncbi:MAG: hypothetical protein PUB18_02330 [bacterium]|nr:hypothetical protein [bacterium]